MSAISSTTAVPPSAPAATPVPAGAALAGADQALTTRYLSHDGGTLAYDDTGGAGPLVVALPGLGDLRQSYRWLAPRLVAAGYRVVTLDLRGMGESRGPWRDYSAMAVAGDALALVRHLRAEAGAGPAVLIGNSHGGGAAAYVAATAPDAVRALVLLDPFVRDPQLAPAMRAALHAAFAGPWGRAAWLALYDREFRARPADHASARARLAAALRAPGAMASVRGMFWAPKAPVAARLVAVRAPTLVVMGAEDPDFPDPAAEARAVAALFTGASAVDSAVLAGVGHYPQAEAPAEVAARAVAFLAAHAPDMSRR